MAASTGYQWRRDRDGRGVWEHRGKVAVAGFGHSPVDRRCKPSPIDGGGLGGGDASGDTSQDMKKHPPDGAAARARSLRQNMTEAEIRVWQMLRAHRVNGYKFRRQVPIGRYIADFVCHEARLVVEIDGGQHDSSSPRETGRSGFLQSQGYRILRFWNNEVLANSDGVQETIVNELAASPPPKPSPIEGEGFPVMGTPSHRSS